MLFVDMRLIYLGVCDIDLLEICQWGDQAVIKSTIYICINLSPIDKFIFEVFLA